MFNFLTKLNFCLQRPRVIIITGNGRFCAGEAIYQVLRKRFKTKKIIEGQTLPFLKKNEILIFQTKFPFIFCFKKLEFLMKRSILPILVVTHLADIPPYLNFFTGLPEESAEILKLAKIIPPAGRLILNFDDEIAREMNDVTNLNTLTFGFGGLADFKASDIKINCGTNLKLNHEGNVIPVRLRYLFGKEQIYSILSAFCVGKILNLNLVEITEALENYKSIPGKMKLIEGIKKSLILDDSESASVFSMIEALEILAKADLSSRFGQKRKIAVLGDVIGVGKYTIEAHEAIGEKIPRSADLLFTVGQKAKFISQAAEIQGMKKENIFSFSKKEELISFLKKEITKGDLVLVDGSKEMEMGEIVKAIKI